MIKKNYPCLLVSELQEPPDGPLKRAVGDGRYMEVVVAHPANHHTLLHEHHRREVVDDLISRLVVLRGLAEVSSSPGRFLRNVK